MKKWIITLLICLIPALSFAAMDPDGDDDFIDFTTDSSHDFIENAESFTVYFTVKGETAANSFERYIHRPAATAGNGWQIARNSTSDINLVIDDAGGSARYAFVSGDFPTTWTTYILTYDRDNNNPETQEVQRSIDGGAYSVINSASTAFGWSATTSLQLFIRRGGANSESESTFGEMAVWNVRLSQTEATQLGASKIKGMALQIAPANLKGYWQLNEVADGASGDGVTFVNLASPGTADGTGDDGANNTGLAGVAEPEYSYSIGAISVTTAAAVAAGAPGTFLNDIILNNVTVN